MQTNLIDMAQLKERWNPDVVYVGDTIVFEDWNNECYEAVVTAIVYSSDEFIPGENVHCMPLCEKEDHILELQDGQSIIGDIVVRKVVRKAANRSFNPANGSHTHAK